MSPGDILIDDGLKLLIQGEGPLTLGAEQELKPTTFLAFDILAEPRFNLLALRHALATPNVDYPAGFDDRAVLLGKEICCSILAWFQCKVAPGQSKAGIANQGVFVSIVGRAAPR